MCGNPSEELYTSPSWLLEWWDKTVCFRGQGKSIKNSAPTSEGNFKFSVKVNQNRFAGRVSFVSFIGKLVHTPSKAKSD